MRPRTLAISLSIAALAAQSIGTAVPALAATPVEVPFAYTGAEQQFDVPADVWTLSVTVKGAPGGTLGLPGVEGRGATVTGDIAVTPSLRLYVEVGGKGTDANHSGGAPGGFNGGGAGGQATNGYINGPAYAAAGGGASDLRTISRADAGSLASRLVVAGGGGGATFMGSTTGGDAGQPGGGGTSGGGAGGTSAGGAGGLNTGPSSTGSLGTGGAGGTGALNAGGGGGGGYYGGGGGAEGGGGGGGSSFVGAATNSSVTIDAAEIPSVTISYVVGAGAPNSGTVDATVTMAQSVVCLELSTGAVDFGTRQFGDVGIAAAPGVTATNCGGLNEDILAHGTDASGTGPTAWTLDDTGTCTGGTLPADHFGLALERQDTNAQVRLSATNKALETLSGGAAIDHLARIDTPCPGSSGAGVVMSMQMTFVATESLP
jgi:Glycine rich protein